MQTKVHFIPFIIDLQVHKCVQSNTFSDLNIFFYQSGDNQMFSSTCGHRVHQAEALEASLLLSTVQGTEPSQLRQLSVDRQTLIPNPLFGVDGCGILGASTGYV